MNFVEELRWRGMLQDIMPGTEELVKQRAGDCLFGYRPDCRFATHWSPYVE